MCCLGGHSFSSKGQASFNFMAAVTICSDFGAQKNKVFDWFHSFPIYLPWSDGTRYRDLSFSECWVLSQLFHSPLPLSSRGSLTFFFNFPHFLKLAQNPFSHPCTKLSNSTGCVPSLPKVLQFPAHPLSCGPSGSSQLVRLAKPSCLTAYFIPGLLVSRFLATGYSMPFASS